MTNFGRHFICVLDQESVVMNVRLVDFLGLKINENGSIMIYIGLCSKAFLGYS